jgi:hypothetical protein
MAFDLENESFFAGPDSHMLQHGLDDLPASNNGKLF